MIPAFLATALFAVSILAAGRSARMLGSHTANFGRVVVAVVLLAIWAHTVGQGFGGGAFALFFLSGCIGFGLGDVALFQALPRLGPRLSSLMINCLAAPFGAAIEWGWLGTPLSATQCVGSLVILTGVALTLAPKHHQPIPRRLWQAGIVFGVLAGLGQALGAVISRKAYAVSAAAGGSMDGGTAAFQRILGGLVIVAIPFLYQLYARRTRRLDPVGAPMSTATRRSAWTWVLLNGLTGPTIGVAFYQWGLKLAPSGVVLSITATTPLLVIPFTRWLEGDRPGPRSLVGCVLAVLGVIVLTA